MFWKAMQCTAERKTTHASSHLDHLDSVLALQIKDEVSVLCVAKSQNL
jgi:hypothetical protein